MSAWTKIERSNFAHELDTRIWMTKGARFAAARRLQYRSTLSTAVIALLSSYSIVASIVLGDLSSPGAQSANYGLILASLIILVLSLIETSQNYAVVAERLHACAIDLSRLYDRLRHAAEYDVDHEFARTLDEIAEEYSRVLKEYHVNHHPMDMWYFLNRDTKTGKVMYGIWSYSFYILMGALPLIAGGVLLTR